MRVYRSSEQAVLIAVIGSAVSILMVVQTVLAFKRGAPWWLTASIACLFLVLSWRGARAAVYAEASGVRIVNPVRTELIKWSDIDRFGLGRRGPWPLVGLIELRDGSIRHMFGIQAPNPLTRPRNRSAQALIEQLNDDLEEARGRAGYE